MELKLRLLSALLKPANIKYRRDLKHGLNFHYKIFTSVEVTLEASEYLHLECYLYANLRSNKVKYTLMLSTKLSVLNI